MLIAPEPSLTGCDEPIIAGKSCQEQMLLKGLPKDAVLASYLSSSNSGSLPTDLCLLTSAP